MAQLLAADLSNTSNEAKVPASTRGEDLLARRVVSVNDWPVLIWVDERKVPCFQISDVGVFPGDLLALGVRGVLTYRFNLEILFSMI